MSNSKAMQLLMNEHQWILSAGEIARQAEKWIGKDDKRYEKIIWQMLDFFKVYADQYHHHKEEEILFPEMSKKQESLGEGIVFEMLDNHSDFRALLNEIENKLTHHKIHDVNKLLYQYTNMLNDHIAVEDNELFPMMETIFSEDEKEKIYFGFVDKDNEFGDKKKKDLENLIEEMKKAV